MKHDRLRENRSSGVPAKFCSGGRGGDCLAVGPPVARAGGSVAQQTAQYCRHWNGRALPCLMAEILRQGENLVALADTNAIDSERQNQPLLRSFFDYAQLSL